MYEAPCEKFPNDSALWDGLRNRNALVQDQAFACVYKHYFTTVRDYILNNSGQEADARDVFQEASTVLWNYATSPVFVPRAKVVSVLMAIAKKTWLYWLRKGKKGLVFNDLSTISVDENGEVQDSWWSNLPADPVENEEDNCRRIKLRKALKKLDEKCRELILDTYWRDDEPDEVLAEECGTSAGVIRVQRFRCMQRLRELAGQENCNDDTPKNL